MKFLSVACVSVIAVSIFWVFVGLAEKSLWVDELFSAYFSDPELPSLRAFFERAAQDVHPPGYYLTLWWVLKTFPGQFELIARGYSAVLGCMALAVIYLAPGPSVRPIAKLVGTAVAVTSGVWFAYSQDARSYSALFVITSFVMMSALRCRECLSAGQLPVRWMVALVAACGAASTIHYYSILVSGAIFGLLLLRCTTWPHRIIVAASGLSVLLLTLLLLSWHLPQIVVEIDNTGFKTTFDFIVRQISRGVRMLLSAPAAAAMLWVFCVSGLLLLRRPKTAIAHATLGPNSTGDMFFVLSTIVLTIGLGLMVTLFFVPMLSFRLFIVLAPVFWIGIAYVVEYLFRLTEGFPEAVDFRPLSTVLIALSLIMTLIASMIFVSTANSRWKQTSHFIANIDGCASSTLPITWFEMPYFIEDDPERFYGYYLPQAGHRKWLKMPRDRFEASVASPQFRSHVMAMMDTPNGCPVLFWSNHFLVSEDIQTAAQLVQNTVAEIGGEGYGVETLHFEQNGEFTILLLRELDQSAQND
ncbi:hypothetical protein [Ruegeria sp. HKCCD7221]|nr:hypothetical protein [Ruegeria sp. HKCCD7221]